MQEHDIKTIIDNNPGIDVAQLCELLKTLQELQGSALVPRTESTIMPPYTRPAPSRQENPTDDPRVYRLRQDF